MSFFDNITGKLLQIVDWCEKRYAALEIAPESEQQTNAIFTALGFFTSLILAVAFFWWAPAGTPYGPFLECLSLALFLNLFIWLLVHKGEPYSRALLLSFFSLVPLSLISATQGPIALAILNALFLFYFVLQRAPSFLRSAKNIKFITFFATVFALVIFAATSKDVGDAFVDEKFRQLTLNPDTLFQASIATMIKNYMSISTGLNGLVRLHFPMFSNFLYARAANIMNIEVIEVYGLASFIVFGPLMILGWVRFCAEMTPKLGQFVLLSILLLLFVVLDQCFGWQSQGYFRSESYLIGLILLPGALSALAPIVRKDGQNQLRNWFTVWLYLPFLSLAQIPIGLGFFLITAYFLLVRSVYSWGSRLGYIIPTVALWWLGDYGARPSGLEAKFKWGTFQEVLGDANVLHFIFSQFIYFFLLLPLVLYRPFRALLNRELKLWLEFFFIFVLVGFFGAQFSAETSGYYFVNLHLFFAIPVLLLIFSTADFRTQYARETAPFVYNYYRILIAFFVGAAAFYVGRIIPESYTQTEQIRRNVLEHRSYTSKYLPLFKMIHDDAAADGFLVYVPKSEHEFWNNSDDTYSLWASNQCIKMPFYIPIATGKPAVLGLPDSSCAGTHYGFETYGAADFKESSVADVDNSVVCKAVTAKGFVGYYRVTLAQGVVKNRCR